MSALPRPDLPPGPHRDLVVELHHLHHRAGWPSLRTLARETGVSHTTVSKAFSTPALPSWGTLELLVEAMDGDIADFRDLWLAATAPNDGGSAPDHPTASRMRIAGRVAELAAVRHHLETGTGLLMVTGEAGIGKTTLVAAAREQLRDRVLVASGNCLPLSHEIPLLPVAEALRQVHGVEAGLLLHELLRSCPGYVQPALVTLLPELSTAGDTFDPDDRWSRQRLFSAIAELLEVLSNRQPFALLLEDLHWADELSLDLVEHLVRTPRARILATWRLDDPDVDQERLAWFTRIRRTAASIQLGALTQDETVAQLRLLRPDTSPEAAAGIHARSGGQPLFTEQLAQADAGEPTFLNDLLDARIARLSGGAWRAASVLGLADRPMVESAIARASGLDRSRLDLTLRELRELRLLDVGDDTVHLRHPLLAEAVRRRLLPSERGDVHRALAEVLSADPEAEPAEIAAHWRGASDQVEELLWRIRAARAASNRFAGSQAADHWLRALELWPEGASSVGDPPIRRHEVVAGVATQLDLAARPLEAVSVLEAALAMPGQYDDVERADQLRLLARFSSTQFTSDRNGLALVEQAIAIYRTGPSSPGLAAALNWKGIELEWHGRRDEAAAVLAEAAGVAAELGDTLLERSVLAGRAWQMAVSGDEGAAADIEEVIHNLPYGHDPRLDLAVAVRHTDILLMTCRSAEAVEAAAHPALELADHWRFPGVHVQVLKGNVTQAWRRSGQVQRAMQVLASATEAEEPDALSFLHAERALLEVLRGNEQAARSRLSRMETDRHQIIDHQIIDPFVVEAQLHFDVWMGNPQDGFESFVRLLHARDDELPPGTAGDLLVLGARAAADMSARSSSAARQDAEATLVALHGRLHHDPFTAPAVRADLAAAPQWGAELARLRGEDALDGWLVATRSWDRLTRPHDAAYCRWRGAEIALRDGQGTLAARLLKKAAVDAREHVPLSRAIAVTRANAP